MVKLGPLSDDMVSDDGSKQYRPYLWLGEDHDAHVRDFKRVWIAKLESQSFFPYLTKEEQREWAESYLRDFVCT